MLKTQTKPTNPTVRSRESEFSYIPDLIFFIIFIIIIQSNIVTDSRIAEVFRKFNECIYSYCLLCISSLLVHTQFTVSIRKPEKLGNRLTAYKLFSL